MPKLTTEMNDEEKILRDGPTTIIKPPAMVLASQFGFKGKYCGVKMGDFLVEDEEIGFN